MIRIESRRPVKDLWAPVARGWRVPDSASGVRCIERISACRYTTVAASSTDARIEKTVSEIRALCEGSFNPGAEADLRKLARQLRAAIRQHVRMAKCSLSAKKLAIVLRDLQDE